MNTTLKNLMIAAGITAAFSMNVLAADATPASAIPATKDQAQRLDRMKAQTPEQRAEHHRAMREQWEKMSPEDRKAMHDAMHKDRMDMSPDECKVRHEAMGKDGMPPQKCEGRHKQMHEKLDKLSPEERQKCHHQSGDTKLAPCPYDQAKPAK